MTPLFENIKLIFTFAASNRGALFIVTQTQAEIIPIPMYREHLIQIMLA